MQRILLILLFVVIDHLYAQISDFDHVNFQKADNLALVNKGKDLDDLPKLANSLTADLETDVEKFRAIYLWVCSNIANDYNFFLKHRKKTQRYKDDTLKLEYWNDRFKDKLFKKLLKRQKTICTGYAYIVRELSKLVGLNCQIVNGFGRISTTDLEALDTPNHSWNAVRLNGKWYLSDPTWASGIIDATKGKFKFEYNDGYFLAHPKLFVNNHFPIQDKWMLIKDDEKPTFQEFLEAPVIYGSAYKILLQHVTPLKLYNEIQKGASITFQYQLLKPIKKNQITLTLDSGFSEKNVTPKITFNENGLLTLEYQFNNSGFYDVHLLIENNLISSYTFKVGKTVSF